MYFGAVDFDSGVKFAAWGSFERRADVSTDWEWKGLFLAVVDLDTTWA